tara:strand:+ start:5269 stop:7281 length:2013 start_codon:yes stop_codon:yes gene_type:complete
VLEKILLLTPLLLPLATAIFLNFVGKYMKVNQIALISSLGLLGSFSATFILFVLLAINDFHSYTFEYYQFISRGLGASTKFEILLELRWDGLVAVMAILITFLSFIIQLFSASYMAEDEKIARYYTYFNFFVFSMLLLVMSGNFVFMFVGWELVGLSSYMLISFWYKKKEASRAGKKAFIINRIGDLGFLIALMMIYNIFGSFNYDHIFDTPILRAFYYNNSLEYNLICFFLMVGAFGKSAQLPLSSWLPDAMEGPTPASALIHAATMVTAGVFMLVRIAPLLNESPSMSLLIATTGTLTAFFAAFVAITQFDIKKVLAYSTISQLGFMFLAVGSGAYVAAIFHLVTHAFFKALLFLGAGAVIHEMHHEQDIRNMGGLITRMPVTGYSMLIGTLAISGIPPLAGFWSKDEILGSTFMAGGLYLPLWILGLITAVMTAFYMGRHWIYIFLGEGRTEQALVANKAPKLMRIPLIVLAIGSVFVGFINTPFFHGLEKVLHAKYFHVIGPPEGLSFVILASISVLAGAIGLFLSNIVFLQKLTNPLSHIEEFKLIPKKIRNIIVNLFGKENLITVNGKKLLSLLERLSSNGLYLDHYGNKILVNKSKSFSRFVAVSVDQLLIDGLINNIAKVPILVGKQIRSLQSGYVRSYLSTFGIMSLILIALLILSIGGLL